MLRAIAITVVASVVALALAWGAGSGGAFVAGVPVLALCAALALGVQWTAFVPAALLKTERFYDLTGAVTYLAVIGLALVLGPREPRAWIAAALVAAWALRLGAYLTWRGAKHGDRRFTEIKQSPPRFLVAWTLQGLWVVLTALAALVVIVSPDQPSSVLLTDVAGLALFGLGFAVEIIADAQKARFRRTNTSGFITTGLWAWSRHPNYVGEIALWIGVLVFASGVLQGLGWLAVVSPIFVIVLLTRISGVPMLEASADERWGEDPEYQAYKERTPVLFLF